MAGRLKIFGNAEFSLDAWSKAKQAARQFAIWELTSAPKNNGGHDPIIYCEQRRADNPGYFSSQVQTPFALPTS